MKTADELVAEGKRLRSLGPIFKDGKPYYICYCSPYQERAITRMNAEIIAQQDFAGLNWRRIKREMRKAGLRAVNAARSVPAGPEPS